jgi:hypothetical protein
MTPPPVIDFNDEQHLYFVNGVWRPSVTQILERTGLVDFSGIPRNIRLAALSRGRRVHKAAQFLVEDDLDMDTVAIEEQGYVEACANFLQTSGFVVLGSERRIAHLEYGYAGTTDAIGLWRGGFALADWCTGDLWESAKDLQTSGYAEALRKFPPPEWKTFTPASPIQRIGVHLHKNGDFSTEPYSDPRDFLKFIAACAVVHEQIRRGKKGKVAA